MKCAWKELLSILPPAMRTEVDNLGKQTLQELRLRLGKPPELVCGQGSRWLKEPVTEQDLRYTVNFASRYSPWAAATSAQGYITAPGGHRVGLCGEVVTNTGQITGFRRVTSVNIRVARDFALIAPCADAVGRNVLILGPPNSGKTTLLRDLIRRISEKEQLCVVDERGELFPDTFDTGPRTDVITGCDKAQGLEMALRTMGPECIAVDEITAQRDCEALVRASRCGVRLLATAHATEKEDLTRRGIYKPLLEQGLFDTLLILRRDKSWYTERMKL